ncbi:unnamed protein product [Haemonchus placei]|uniref:Uncharacterized protein n=1 Tax=Haemonchus placei TaxID=6290 RepID=A0A3P7XXB9_HAEPC|nr:unnamed protein product [Haemonchus placei]
MRQVSPITECGREAAAKRHVASSRFIVGRRRIFIPPPRNAVRS